MTGKTILAVMLISVLGGGLAWYDHHQKRKAGYCFAENRMITDDELVDTAVTQLLKNIEKEYQSLTPEEQSKRIRYVGLKDFYERQPGCCGSSGDDGKSNYPPEPARIWYKDHFGRSILYQYSRDGQKKYRGVLMWVDFCGRKAHADAQWRSNGQTYQDRWGIGTPTSILPQVKSRKDNFRKK